MWKKLNLCGGCSAMTGFALGDEDRTLAARIKPCSVVLGQAREPAHPLLWTGRGVDHVGTGVRDLDKAGRDYEKVLGFKCTEKLPSYTSGAS